MRVARHILGSLFLLTFALPIAVLFDILEWAGRLGDRGLRAVCNLASQTMK